MIIPLVILSKLLVRWGREDICGKLGVALPFFLPHYFAQNQLGLGPFDRNKKTNDWVVFILVTEFYLSFLWEIIHMELLPIWCGNVTFGCTNCNASTRGGNAVEDYVKDEKESLWSQILIIVITMVMVVTRDYQSISSSDLRIKSHYGFV